jgi:hypothetical protein
MNRFRNYVLMAAGFAVLVLVVGVFSAGPAIAQAVRAALVSNVDDPGRIPYQFQKVCLSLGSDCSVSLPPVPTGKRLVTTHVSGYFAVTLPPGTLAAARYFDGNLDRLTTQGIHAIPVTLQGLGSFGDGLYIFNQSILGFTDAGQSARLTVELGIGASYDATITVTGYMLDCNAAPCVAIAP